MLGSTANVQTNGHSMDATNAAYTAEAMFWLTFGQAPMGMAVMLLDGHITNANPEFCRMLGYNETELAARTFRDITYLDDLPDSDDLYTRLRTGSPANNTLDVRYVRKDGALVLGRLVVSLVRDHAGAPLYFISMITDLASSRKGQEDLKYAQEENKYAQARTRAILNNLDDFVYVIGFEGLLTYVSPGCTKLLGWSPDELVGKDLFQFIYPDDRDIVKSTIEQFLTGSDKRLCLRCRAYHKEGQWVWVDTYAWAVPGPSGPRHEIAGMIRDISEYEREHSTFVDEIEQAHARRAAEEELALTDQLTGLRNRLAADDTLMTRINSVRASAFPVGCLLVDIDHFKQVNEHYGSAVGDQVLKHIGSLIAASCRHDDFLARYNADQFVIVLPNTNPAGAIICGEKLIKNIRAADWSSTPIEDRITVSIGATCVQFGSGLTVPELLGILESQLNQAKEGGRNRIVMNTRQITGSSSY